MKNLLIICGGVSAEHEISLRSARNVYAALQGSGLWIHIMMLSRSGTAYLLLNPSDLERYTVCEDAHPPGPICTLMREHSKVRLLSFDPLKNATLEQESVDIVFPLIHGPLGEDGSLQGWLDLLGVPYVGSGVLSSALCMDKDYVKRLLLKANLPIVPSLTAYRLEEADSYEKSCAALGTSILFIKPAVMGSSVGISKVKSAEEYLPALQLAFEYSRKIIIEAFIPGRELEVAVLGSPFSQQHPPQASCVGEIVPHHDFYSYEAKYLDPQGAGLLIPAPLSSDLSQRIQALALKAYTVLECEGMTRMDFFLGDDHRLYINEPNTIPGFTSISMYPKLWEQSGVSYSQLINILIEIALARAEHQKNLCLQPCLP